MNDWLYQIAGQRAILIPMTKLLPSLALCGLIFAQATDDVNARIRKEESEHSRVMYIEHMLTDRYGPRMTGTPNHEAAANWLVKQLTEWGFKNAHLEPWDFNHPGWLNERADGHIISPVQQNLKFEVLAWTPSTNGILTAPVVELEDMPQGPPAPVDATANAAAGAFGPFGRGGAPQRLGATREELTRWLDANKDKIRGKMVMIGKQTVVPVSFDPIARRLADDQVHRQYDPANAGRGGRAPTTPDPNRLTADQVRELLDAWLVSNGAVLRVSDAARPYGFIFVAQNRGYDPSKTIPTVVVRNEDYGRIERLLADGEEVKLEFNIVNHVYPEGKTSYNVVGEIPGTDKADGIWIRGTPGPARRTTPSAPR